MNTEHDKEKVMLCLYVQEDDTLQGTLVKHVKRDGTELSERKQYCACKTGLYGLCYGKKGPLFQPDKYKGLCKGKSTRGKGGWGVIYKAVLEGMLQAGISL